MNRRQRLGASLFFGLFILIGVVWTCQNIGDYDEYRRLEGIAVTVQAQVTRVESSGDDDMPYALYVTYEHAGETWQDILYGNSTLSDMLGKTITMQIDPENPTVRRPKDPGSHVYVISSLFIAPAGFMLLWFLSIVHAEEGARERGLTFMPAGLSPAIWHGRTSCMS